MKKWTDNGCGIFIVILFDNCYVVFHFLMFLFHRRWSKGTIKMGSSVRLSVRLLVLPSVRRHEMGSLWTQVLLQFSTDLFETLHVFLSWSEDVHLVFWVILPLFSLNSFSTFSTYSLSISISLSLFFFKSDYYYNRYLVGATPPRHHENTPI